MAGFHDTFQRLELLVMIKQCEYIIFFRMQVTFWWIMPFGGELLASDIYTSFDLFLLYHSF